MDRHFTNFKIEEIEMWDFTKLRSTKEYQEKRKKFIEDNGGKCPCGSTERLSVSHPQQYLKIIYSKEKGKFYSVYSKLKYKEVCPSCHFDKAYEDVVQFKSEISRNKKRRTMIKFKHLCPNCEKRYKYPRKIKVEELRIVTELTNYQIPNTEDFRMVCSKIQNEINKQQWQKYISFIDAELVCRDCHYVSHFIPLTIIQKIPQEPNEQKWKQKK